MRIAGLIKDSLIEGPGVNLVVITQGCNIKCKNCHNESTHDPMGGYTASIDEILSNTTIITTGITISGGEPTLQLGEVLSLAAEAKARGLQTLLYTGLTEAQVSSILPSLIPWFDYIKIGPYVDNLKDTSQPYKGSSNQKLYRIKEGKLLQVC